jgi:hypothetical protein
MHSNVRSFSPGAHPTTAWIAAIDTTSRSSTQSRNLRREVCILPWGSNFSKRNQATESKRSTSPRAHHLSLERNSFSRVFDAGARGLVLPLHNITTRISISSSVPREVINIIKSTLSWSQVCAQCFERGFGWEMFYRQSINYNYVSHNW